MSTRRERDRAQWRTLAAMAGEETRRLLDDLPEDLQQQAETLQVVFEDAPGPALCRAGVAADTMGLFEGDALDEELSSDGVLPRRIILFLDNILEQAEGDPDAFRAEVRDTLLHELGHYLGLDEDDLVDRGLE